MKITDVPKALDILVPENIVPLLMGPAGIGKTSVVKQWAKANGYTLIPLLLGQISDAGDITGMPYIENGIQKFARPTFFPKENDKKYLIFLDEINRAQKDILQAIFQLILEKRIGDHILPLNTVIIAASNPPTDEYTVLDFSDKAWLSRFCIIKTEEDLDGFLKFGNEKIPNTLKLFLKENPIYFIKKGEDFSVNDFVSPDPRAWLDQVAPILYKTKDEALLQELLIGLVGVEATIPFLKYLEEKEIQKITGLDILNGNFDINSLQQLSPDVIHLALEDLENEVNTNKKDITKELFTFLQSINKDIAFGFINLVLKRKFESLENTTDYNLIKIAQEPWENDFILTMSKIKNE